MTADGKIVAVCGPTASGKSMIAMMIAESFGGEIVCCDSMQIYRGMDIGTAKPSAEDRRAVPHHMVDFQDPHLPYSCADYSVDARKCVTDVLSRGRLPVICGGTGLYLDSLLFERSYDAGSGKSEIRERLAREAEKLGNAAMWEKLKTVDPESAAAVHPNNVRRVVRALEIYEQCGVPKSVLDRQSGAARFDFFCAFIGANDRAVLNRRIERRADAMIADGLAAETAALESDGVFSDNQTAAKAIGYKEILPFIHGEKSLCEAREDLVVATRRYAKRQETWFGAKNYAVRFGFDVSPGELFGKIRRSIANYLDG